MGISWPYLNHSKEKISLCSFYALVHEEYCLNWKHVLTENKAFPQGKIRFPADFGG